MVENVPLESSVRSQANNAVVVGVALDEMTLAKGPYSFVEPGE